MQLTLDHKKATAAAWFRELRDTICAEFEKIETEYATVHGACSSREGFHPEPHAAGVSEAKGTRAPSRNNHFTRTPWQRAEGDGGEISMMKGRVFEKVGVNISTVQGEFSEQFRKEIPGAESDPRYWASGISLVAHMASPLVPAAHFNTRMIVVGEGQRIWFGGGGDLNPMVENTNDTDAFHGAFAKTCAAHDPEFYPAFNAWCDEYFYIPHRNVARGVGGIFYDYLGLNRYGQETTPVTSGKFGKGGVTAAATAHGMDIAANTALDWAGGLAFTQQVGRTFASIYPALIRQHMDAQWTEAQRHHQLVSRGRYAEYNLLYDRGTRFGLMTGGNTEAILMSLPPMAVWE